eukprot:GHVN01066492.1.p1 GENE.GHVN01066492.1~~GHVN01066492.1.p1  ORF type:complete len:545 (+),score=37.13 GHVN01066492.1:68-1702(+)
MCVKGKWLKQPRAMFNPKAFLSFVISLECFMLFHVSSQAAADSVVAVPIYGGVYEYAYYFVDIFVGSSDPPQRQSVILDSGSSLLAFPCTFCRDCGFHIDPPFDMKKSPTARFVECDGRCPCDRIANRCKYSVEYEEGSAIRGYYINDLVALGSIQTSSDGASSHVKPLYPDEPNVTWLSRTTTAPPLPPEPPTTQHLTDVPQSVVSAPAYIGCHSQETNQFLSQQASGVMGISFRSDDEEQTVMNSIFNAHSVSRRMFSVCLSHFGGLFSVGGFRSSMMQGGAVASRSVEEGVELEEEMNLMVFEPLLNRRSYSIALHSMEVNNEIIATNDELMLRAGVLLDTGTTYTLLPAEVLDRFIEQLQRHCDKSKSNCVGKWLHGDALISNADLREKCWMLDKDSDLKSFPSIILKGSQTVLSIEPHTYMYPRMRSRVWCVGLKEHPEDGVVLGATFFIHRNVLFDLENYRIGFADATCPSATRSGTNSSIFNQPVSRGDSHAFAVSLEAASDTDVAEILPTLGMYLSGAVLFSIGVFVAKGQAAEQT